ncbi:hypothetical protein RD792_012832 [Penstemon davidsonii]|uniref:BHLH domain-containing protein n=1 Tax=Penstemon davidsonii TaxID=160366 RepID=A0ABR0CYT6_9LAMI|nr:hypothetical protein RD792_012832 [Penstemon davidsonii]
MKQPNSSRDRAAMNNINSLLNQHQISHNHTQSQMSPSSDFDTSSHDGFLEQMLSSPASFPWSDDHAPPHLDDQMRMHQISNKALILQHHQQLLLSNGLVDGSFLKSANPDNDAAVKAMFNGFTGSLNQSQNFHNPQSQDFGAPAAPTPSGAGKPKQRVRARRGQATDPHSIAERLRRERIADRMKALQELVPNPNKVLSMSRLGGAAATKPLVADMSPEGRRSSNGTLTVPSSNNNEGTMVTENQVVKMMEEDMGSAMQYLQGKGLCLMPISLATAISTSTCHTRNPLARSNNLNINGNGEDGGPSSPSMSVLTAQSAAMGGSGGGEVSVKDATSVSKLDSSS